MGEHRGIVNHEPSELVLTVRAGTSVADTQAALAGHDQWLAFDPPRHEESSTIGGAVACALSGPSRPWTGAVRDFVLGTRIVNGRGDVLSFGGEVMKNVAGYDVSRLMAGAFGTLGVLLEVSFKLLPRPARDRTRVLDLNAGEAIRRLVAWARTPLPILGACHDGERLHVRLAGAEPAVAEAEKRIGGEPGEGSLWEEVRDHRHPFFAGEGPPVWRLSLPAHTPSRRPSGRRAHRLGRGPAVGAKRRAGGGAAGGRGSGGRPCDLLSGEGTATSRSTRSPQGSTTSIGASRPRSTPAVS